MSVTVTVNETFPL